MSKKNLVPVLVLALVALVCLGCSHHNPLPPISGKGGLEPGSSMIGVADHGVRLIGAATGGAAAWLMYAALIVGLPWLVIALIPGVIAGKWEMKIEGGLILLACFLLLRDDAFRAIGLTGWMIWLDAIPAAVILFWESESGKFVLFGIPAALFALVCGFKVISAIGAALASAPITTLAVALGIIVLILWLRVGKEATA
jgi:hypothetical protein